MSRFYDVFEEKVATLDTRDAAHASIHLTGSYKYRKQCTSAPKKAVSPKGQSAIRTVIYQQRTPTTTPSSSTKLVPAKDLITIFDS
ncbi:hypothetical protein KIN20_031370 [Parelaphostrongylus tenuis]|uniref:Uncharacterized protein n=1 Tax=Parelaphostrongylus tenuis TaxID=148309 RepID=A0AAD5WGY9_PARTN|nr:hypothetical protein KIN20_031370 [Parelaphostrongylus tenuis]